MTAELEVAYLGIQVADPAGFGAFMKDVVGLVPGDPTAGGAATWRNDDRVHRIIVEEGPANDAVFVGLEAGSPEAFERAVMRARAAGAPPPSGQRAARKGRRARRPALRTPRRSLRRWFPGSALSRSLPPARARSLIPRPAQQIAKLKPGRVDPGVGGDE